MLEIKTKVEIYCTCGTKIKYQYYDANGNILIGPCERCLEKARKAGHEKGYDDGHEAGYYVGYAAGIGD